MSGKDQAIDRISVWSISPQSGKQIAHESITIRIWSGVFEREKRTLKNASNSLTEPQLFPRRYWRASLSMECALNVDLFFLLDSRSKCTTRATKRARATAAATNRRRRRRPRRRCRFGCRWRARARLGSCAARTSTFACWTSSCTAASTTASSRNCPTCRRRRHRRPTRTPRPPTRSFFFFACFLFFVCYCCCCCCCYFSPVFISNRRVPLSLVSIRHPDKLGKNR